MYTQCNTLLHSSSAVLGSFSSPQDAIRLTSASTWGLPAFKALMTILHIEKTLIKKSVVSVLLDVCHAEVEN
jgi:hypothetical protein